MAEGLLAPALNTALAPEAAGTPDLRRIYEQHFEHVWHTLRRLGVPERNLEDAAHEVFIVVHRRLDSYDPARPLRPWLSGIAHRVASAERRRAHHRHEQPEDEREYRDGTPGADEQLQAREERALVLEALDRLPDEQRVVFVMHELDGFGMPEIAGALEVPLNTCYSRLRLARKGFQAAVERALARRGGR